MLRLVASCMLILSVCGCNKNPFKAAALPTGCRMATVADLAQIQLFVDRRDVSEVVGRERTGEIGESLDAFREGLTVSQTAAQLRLMQAPRRGNRSCLAFGWKVVSVGPDPADAADFGGRLPSGVAIVRKDDPDTHSTYINVRAVDDHVTEPNEHFRIELTDVSGKTIWGRAEPDHDNNGFLRNTNPKSVVYTIHDTERDCVRPGGKSGYIPSVQEQRGTYRLIIQEPDHPRQCAYVAWRYWDDTLDNDDPDYETFLQGMAYFSSDEDSAGLSGYQQSFDLGIPFNKNNAGRSVRIILGTTSSQPTFVTLKLPSRRGI